MISVCVATYNGSKYIEEQLASILPQLGENDEVIVSDGGSTDDTFKIVESIKDKRIKILTFQQPQLRHQPYDVWQQMSLIRRNFENALRVAKGEFIFLSDQDDVWLPDKVAKVLSLMGEQTMCVTHDAKVTDENLQEIHSSIMKLFRPSFGKWGVLWKSPFMGCCMTVRQEVVKRALPMPDGVEYDTWLGCVANHMGNVKFINDALLLYRRHECNASSLAHMNKNSIIVKFRRRYNILKNCVHYLLK